MSAQAFLPSASAPESLLPHALTVQHSAAMSAHAIGSTHGNASNSTISATSTVSAITIGSPASVTGSPPASNGMQPDTVPRPLEYMPYKGSPAPVQGTDSRRVLGGGGSGLGRKMASPSDNSPLPTPDHQRGQLAVVTHRRVSASITPVDLRVHEAAAAAAEAGDESDDDFHDLQQGTGTPRETASSSEPDQDLLAPADPAQAAQAKPLDSSRLGLGNGGVPAEALRAGAGLSVVEETESESGSQAGAAEEDTHWPQAEPSSFARPKEQPKQQQPQQQPVGGPDDKRKEPKQGWADEMDKQEEGVTAAAKSNGARHGNENSKPANWDASAREAASVQQKSERADFYKSVTLVPIRMETL
jgi:hypothetical protein